ncbi:MAG: glycosyltransferase [Rhodothermales bacterium]
MSVEEKWTEGNALLSGGALNEAIRCFEEALALDPNHKQTLNSLGCVALAKNDPRTATSFFIKALEQDPCCEETVGHLWQAYSRLGRQQDMVPLLKQLVQQCPHADTFQHLLTQATASESGAIPSALTSEEKAWSMSPDVFAPLPDRKAQTLLREAQAQLNAGRPNLAATSLWRCARITRFADPNLLQALARIYKQQQDIPALQRLWKRATVAALERSDYDAFLHFSYISIYAEQLYANEPTYEYAFIDEDLNAYIRLAARTHPLAEWVRTHRTRKQYKQGQSRLKIGFVLEGYSRFQAPSQLYLPLAQHHDPGRFDLFFYSRHPLGTPMAAKEDYGATKAVLEQAGATVWAPDAQQTPMAEVDALAKRIVQDQIDALIYQTTYFVPPYNLLSYLRTVPFQAAIEHQQPEFSQALDLVFANRKAGLDSLCEVAPFPMAFTKAATETALTRSDFGLPESALVLMSVNRDVRYAQDRFWHELAALLERHSDACFVAVGLATPPAVLAEYPRVEGRVVTPGFRTDVPACLAAADIYIDLFPSGGGSSLVEAMTLGVPVVCFEQDYASPYAVNSEILSEYVDEPALVVPHGRYAAWHDVLNRLIQEPALRRRMGKAMLERAGAFASERVSEAFFNRLEEAFFRRVTRAS